jgi:hypothetical protein
MTINPQLCVRIERTLLFVRVGYTRTYWIAGYTLSQKHSRELNRLANAQNIVAALDDHSTQNWILSLFVAIFTIRFDSCSVR